MKRACLLPLTLLLALTATALSVSNLTVLDRDVVVIGGGASGTYAAIRLQEEGKTVALFEKENRLGGHVNTYTDPTTNQTVDYGVQVFSNITVLRNFFAHFNVPLADVSFTGAGSSTQALNFLTGASITGSANELAIGEALVNYQTQLHKYPGIAVGWDLPSSVPLDGDLLMDFGDFMTKYNLSAMAPVAFSYNQGMGNLLAQPTLYVMKYFDAQLVSDILTGNLVANGLSDNQLLYNRAQAELGDNVLLSSEVTSVTRCARGVEVEANTPTGPVTVRASKILISIPPLYSNLPFLDMDDNETSLFSQFNHSYYWDAVVKNMGLPAGLTLSNANPAAPEGIPAMPAVYTVSATAISDTNLMYYSSPYSISDDEVKTALLNTAKTIATAQGYKVPASGPEIVGFNNHSPFILAVSKEAVNSSFYSKLEALQGERNTWWTGAAWNTQATAELWNFTETQILPQLLR